MTPSSKEIVVIKDDIITAWEIESVGEESAQLCYGTVNGLEFCKCMGRGRQQVESDFQKTFDRVVLKKLSVPRLGGEVLHHFH